MQIIVTVTLGTGDALEYTPDEAAAAILAELNGDPANDFCQVQVVQNQFGSAGESAPSEAPLEITPHGEASDDQG